MNNLEKSMVKSFKETKMVKYISITRRYVCNETKFFNRFATPKIDIGLFSLNLARIFRLIFEIQRKLFC